eukprot:8525469-Pyramimonas_sp.AAC.1
MKPAVARGKSDVTCSSAKVGRAAHGALGKHGGAALADPAVNLGLDDAAGRSRLQRGRGKKHRERS